MGDVKLGDWLLTEHGRYECVFHVDHYPHHRQKTDMICIQHEKRNIIMTKHHYIYIHNGDDMNDLKCIIAGKVKIGDNIKYMNDNNNLELIKVINVSICS